MTISADESRAARELLGMSREVLANISRVSRTTIVAFENRQKLPRYNTVDAIRRALEAAGVDLAPANRIPHREAGVKVRKAK